MTTPNVPSSSLPAETPAPLIPYAPDAPASVSPATSLPTQIRIWCASLFLVSASMLGIGAWMTPSPHGIGTHAENLGLPPCGFYIRTGIPCPTCGCTTAVTWVAHGHIGMAFFVQPFGAVVGLLAIAGTTLGLVGLVSGRWVGPALFTLQWHWKLILWSSGLLLVSAWIYKIIMVRHGYR